jgi:hypothetical protein
VFAEVSFVIIFPTFNIIGAIVERAWVAIATGGTIKKGNLKSRRPTDQAISGLVIASAFVKDARIHMSMNVQLLDASAVQVAELHHLDFIMQYAQLSNLSLHTCFCASMPDSRRYPDVALCIIQLIF